MLGWSVRPISSPIVYHSNTRGTWFEWRWDGWMWSGMIWGGLIGQYDIYNISIKDGNQPDGTDTDYFNLISLI